MQKPPYLKEGDCFPCAKSTNSNGIVAYGGSLSSTSILNAYKIGIFPWFNKDEPITWWSPHIRSILLPHEFKKSKSLDKRIRNGGFEIRFDYNFSATIQACAKVNNRADETWIVPMMIKAYEKIHTLGYAHSIEIYLKNELVGGLYGISLGNAFFGESMFAKVNDASKVALWALVEFALEKKFIFIDCQIPSKHLISLGAICIKRDLFLEILAHSMTFKTKQGSWSK